MKSALRLTSLVTILCALFALAGLIALYLFFIVQYFSVPYFAGDLGAEIVRIEDISVVKKVCVPLANALVEEPRVGARLAWWGLGFLIFGTGLCGLLSAYTHRELRRLNETTHAASRVDSSIEPAKPLNDSVITKAINGKLELWKVVLLVYVPGYVLLAMVSGAIFAGMKEVDALKHSNLQFYIVPILLSASYLCIIGLSVVVWRCASNTRYRLFTYLVRPAIVLSFAVPLLNTSIFWAYIAAR